MHLDGQQIGAGNQIRHRDSERPAVGWRGHAGGRERCVTHWARRHVLPINLGAVEVINCAVVNDRVQQQLRDIRPARENIGRAKIPGDDPPTAGVGEREFGVLRRRENGSGAVK